MNQPTSWFEAVNSEFLYEQSQIKDINAIGGGQIFEENFYPNEPSIQPDPAQKNVQFQRPIAMHLNNQVYVGADSITTYAPCQGPKPWNFAQCYGFYGQPACPLVNIIDMEDFM